MDETGPTPTGDLPGRPRCFLWSAQDNFEWMDGFGNCFGFIFVDFDSLSEPRSSALIGFERPRGRNAVV